MTDALLSQSLVVILASACAIALLTRVGLPAPLGYLLAGLVIGPHGLQLVVASDETRFLAELGVIFLMFMVGLEFSLPTLIAARTDVFGAGSLQLGLTSLIVAGGAMLAGVDWRAAILLAGAVAMSSTAIALKQLADQGEISSQHGRLTLGILLFQDLVTLPFLIVVGAWQQRGEPDTLGVLRQLAVATIVLGGAAVASRPVFRMALSWVARAKSADLFLLSVLLLALGTAFAARNAGIAAPIGAFLAGMVIGESDFRHQVEDDIRPFRDVLLGLFFVTVGMEVNPSIVAVSPWTALAWTAALLPGKVFATAIAGTIMRWPPQAGVRVAIILAHGGEFGLLLVTQAIGAGIVDPQIGQPALLALAGTMGLAPILIQWNSRIARLVGGASLHLGAAAEAAIRDESQRLADHVLLCGCGRVGRLVAVVLAAGLALAHQALLLTGFTQDDAAGVITKVRAELNPELRGRVGV